MPSDRRQRIESTARKFFALSLEEKRKVRRDEVKIMGYYDKEHTKNVRDWKEVSDFSVEDPTLVAASLDPDDNRLAYWTNQWPENPPELKCMIHYSVFALKSNYRLQLELSSSNQSFSFCNGSLTAHLTNGLIYWITCQIFLATVYTGA